MPRSEAHNRTLSAQERARVERRIEGLLAECVAKHQQLWSGDADFAEAHGIYHTLRTLGFKEADEIWNTLRDAADAPRLEQLRRQMALPIAECVDSVAQENAEVSNDAVKESAMEKEA